MGRMIVGMHAAKVQTVLHSSKTDHIGQDRMNESLNSQSIFNSVVVNLVIGSALQRCRLLYYIHVRPTTLDWMNKRASTISFNFVVKESTS